MPYNVFQNPRVIFFPKLNYRKISGFWKKVKNYSETLLAQNDPIINQIINLLPDDILDYTSLKRGWKRTERFFWQYVNKNFPAYFKGIKTIEVRPTNYGSIVTAYSTLIKNNNQRVVVYIRADADFSHIAEAIFLERFEKKLINLNYSWEEIEAIIDFLLAETELAKFFPNYKKTLASLRQLQQGKLAQDSKKYLQSLGFSFHPIFELKNQEILVNGKKSPIGLSFNEEKLLRFFIEKRGEIISPDKISVLLWGEASYEKFSLYAIAKLLERLRKKIEKMGVPSEIIQTVRGKGYLLM